jgi:hypothetical protein
MAQDCADLPDREAATDYALADWAHMIKLTGDPGDHALQVVASEK